MKAHRGGHSPNCKGASGYVDEVMVNREINKWVGYYYDLAGESHVDCSSDKHTSSDDLRYGTDLSNSKKADFFSSIHLNAYKTTEQPMGVEVWVHRLGGEGYEIGKRIQANLVKLGFKDRGVKSNSNFHDLKCTVAPSVIVECFFCDSKADVDLYNTVGAKAIAAAIVEGVLNRKVEDAPVSQPTPEPSKPQINNWVARLQAECNRQGFSNQKVDGIPGPSTLKGCPLLEWGAKGEITKLLQEKLTALGYNTNGVDGIFGNGTRNAVVKFQRDNGLSSDGIVGKNTWSKLIY